MTASQIPLAGPEAQILHYLAQVVAIGKHNKSWTAADVVRVAEAHLPHAHTLRRQLSNERARADRAEVEVAMLRETVMRLRERPEPSPWDPPAAVGGRRVVTLTPRLAAALDVLVTGASNEVVAERLGLALGSVANLVGEVIREFGARTRLEVVVWALTKQVVVRTSVADRRAA